MGAEHFGHFEMATLGEEMQVEIAEQWAERIRILGLLHRARPGDAQEVRRLIGHDALEHAVRLLRLERADAARRCAVAPRPSARQAGRRG